MVFEGNFLADYVFCPGLGKVKPSFTDQKSSNLTRFRWGQQIVSRLSANCQSVCKYWSVCGKAVGFGCINVAEEKILNDNTVQS